MRKFHSGSLCYDTTALGKGLTWEGHQQNKTKSREDCKAYFDLQRYRKRSLIIRLMKMSCDVEDGKTDRKHSRHSGHYSYHFKEPRESY